MDTALIFLAFANDADSHLELLKEESERIFKALEEPERKSYIKIHREESADIEEVFEGFTRYMDQISIFHYAGHADGEGLLLEGGRGSIKGLSKLIGEQKNLKLVFLNGCSSQGQVDELFEEGVKAVIATSAPVQDTKAMEFAEQFYQALAHRRSISQAFILAEAYLKTRYAEEKTPHFRTMIFNRYDEQEEEKDKLPWALYIKEGYEAEIRNWKLPYYHTIGLPQEMIQYIGSSFSANRYIMLVLDEMCKYNPDIYDQMMEQRGGERLKKDSRYYPEIIIRNFPWPIGSQIRLLRVADEANLERLETLIGTYIITGKMLYYILLSDFWNQVRNSKIELDEDFKTGFPLNKEAYLQFDFWAEIPKIYTLFSNKGTTTFLPEFELLISAWEKLEGPFRKAHQFLQKLRLDLQKKARESDVEKLCLQSEQALSILLKQAAFLARYRMLTVRNIGMEKTRLGKVMYELDMGALNALEDKGLGMYQDADNRRKASFSHSHSIILTVNENRLDDSLNLSPFIMDKFTFAQAVNKHKNSSKHEAKIYLMAWEEAERLHYLSVDHQYFLALRNQHKEDQIHTDIQASAYQEGKVQTSSTQTSSPFGEDPFATVKVKDKSPKVFAVLKDEFETFKLDTNPKSMQV